MTSTWKKMIAGFAFVAVLGSQVGVASAGKSCGSHRNSAAPAIARFTVAPVAVAPNTVPSTTFVPESVVPPAGVRPAAFESTAVAPIDIELYDIRLVDNGNDEQGPCYRLIVKNLGRTAVTSEITVALLASMEKDSNDNVSVIGSLESLASGATKSIDLRLPKGAEALTYLTAAVAPADGSDANETDNVAIYERNTILAAR